jgi:hypothetical protein
MTLKNDASFRYDSMVIRDGQVIGTWKRTVTKNSVDTMHDFFKPLDRLQSKAVNESLDHLGNFLNLKINRQ